MNCLKIWIDILTPKQLLFSESIVEKLGEKHDIFCTSREYNEVVKLAKIRNFELIFVGKHGGSDKDSKLNASIDRIKKLSKRIKRLSPDLVISFCSPEAARIAFGLKIEHIAFCDSPHADSVMRLTIPLIQKLLIPSNIPKKEFSKYGISEKKIFSYKAIDAIVTIQRKVNEKTTLPFKDRNKKNILIRLAEDEASYISKSNNTIPIIKKIVNEYKDENVVILGRYSNQVKNLHKVIGKEKKIVKMSFDGKHLLNNTDIFIGSGGTMTAESALMGVPTISYNAVPNIIEDYLAKMKLIQKETNPDKISKKINKILLLPDNRVKKRAEKIISEMEDPIQKLISIMEKKF